MKIIATCNHMTDSSQQSSKEMLPMKDRFLLTKAQGRTLAAETLCTHFGKCGAATDAYLDDKYSAAFDYYDVNKDGRIDAIGMASQLMRFLCQPLGWLDI